MKPTGPIRGDVWLLSLDPTVGHEQAGTRPCLVISVDRLNQGPAGVAMILPITSINRKIPSHVEVRPPEGGLKSVSHIKCEDLRSVSKQRFIKRLGSVHSEIISEVELRLRLLLGL